MIQHLPSRSFPSLIVAIMAVVSLAACAAADSGESTSPSVADSTRPARSGAGAEPVPSESAEAAVGEVPADLVDRILADAAERADVDPSRFEIVRAESVVWSDGSLGCPEPGQLYTQALVAGYHVVVEADGTELDYRATENGDFRLCEEPGPPSGG